MFNYKAIVFILRGKINKMAKFDKSKKNRRIILFIVLVILIIRGIVGLISNNSKKSKENLITNETVNVVESKINKDLGWELTLVNLDNKIPENYKITLKNIDEYRQFDSRAIEYLNNMMNDMIKAGISNVWVQSAYRSIESQTKVYNDKIKEYESQGKTKEEAKELTERLIMIPGCSDHNLGLAVDFNYVEDEFENTKGFKWLTENAEDYGFIIRYPKNKENITKVKYEPWHWRYVGEKNAKEMNKLGMCLEEYVEYLNNKK